MTTLPHSRPRRQSATDQIDGDIAGKINREHRLAWDRHDEAMQHALRCGLLLIEQKSRLKHGEWMPWLAKHCEFSQASANVYMMAARKFSPPGISSLRSLFASGRAAQKRPELGDRAVRRAVQ